MNSRRLLPAEAIPNRLPISGYAGANPASRYMENKGYSHTFFKNGTELHNYKMCDFKFEISCYDVCQVTKNGDTDGDGLWIIEAADYEDETCPVYDTWTISERKN